MVVAIIGASGTIGKRMSTFFELCDSNIKLIKTFYNEKLDHGTYLDVTNYELLEKFIVKYKPDNIVWLSGYKNINWCENNCNEAYSLNVNPIKYLLNIVSLNSVQTRVIYISTDYVFDGREGMYKENDICRPSTIYGKTKLKAENILKESSINHLIIRTSAVMSRHDGFLEWLIRSINTKKPICAFSNIYFSPIPIEYLNRELYKYLKINIWKDKIVHIAGERISRYQFSKRLLSLMGMDTSEVMEEHADLKNTVFQYDLSLHPTKAIEDKLRMWDLIIEEAKLD